MEKTECDVVIVGAGLSGLSVAHFLRKMRPELDLLVLEKSARPGGTIQSFRQQGFLAEWGPHGFLDNIEESRELLDDLGLAQEAQRSPLKRFVRYVCRNGRLVVIPQNPLGILTGAFMPFCGKLRILAEPWKKPRLEEQTVAQWVAHRFGSAMLPLADIAVTGTHAGDMERLSFDAIMPGVRRLELEHGSVIRGLLRKKKTKEKTGLPSMVSFREGMERIVQALADKCTVALSTGVVGIARQGTGWLVQSQEGSFSCKQAVIATHINQALSLLAPLRKPPKEKVPEARIVNVVLGFGASAEVPFGFGYLAPENEKRFAMGALFSTHMFPGRSPEGMVLVEALVGGRRHPERLALDDSLLVQKTYEDLASLMKLPSPPSFVHVLRPEVGIPQLEIGHGQLQKWRDQIEREQAGLHICGFGWEGIGMNDMIKKAKAVATAVSLGQTAGQGHAAVKGVYF